jgi:hypothetical protein
MVRLGPDPYTPGAGRRSAGKHLPPKDVAGGPSHLIAIPLSGRGGDRASVATWDERTIDWLGDSSDA